MANAKPKADPKADAAAAAPAGSKKKLVVIAAAAVLLLGGGGGAAWYFMQGGDAAAQESPKDSKKKMLVMILAGVLVAGAGAGGAWFFTKDAGGASEEKPAKSDKKKKKSGDEDAKPEFVALEPFTVNLQPENGEQYLQVQFTLQVGSPEEAEHIKTNMARVRSRVLMLLSAKRASELTSTEGKQKLSQELIAAVNEPFNPKGDEQEVSDVLFTSFIIQ